MRSFGSITIKARVFHFSPTDVERLVLHPEHPTEHIHHKANSIGSGHASEDHAFLQAVAQSIADAGAVLVTGPANAKTVYSASISLKTMPRMRLAMRAGWKSSSASIFSPVPMSLIGLPVTARMESAAPPRPSPSTRVN